LVIFWVRDGSLCPYESGHPGFCKVLGFAKERLNPTYKLISFFLCALCVLCG